MMQELPDNPNSHAKNLFKPEEKRYKRYQGKQTDYTKVVDLRVFNPEDPVFKGLVELERRKFEGRSYEVYKFAEPEGLLVIKNYTDAKTQVQICQKALNKYICKPHRTNMFIYEKDNQDLPLGNPAKAYNKDKFLVDDSERYSFNTKIRWANLGRQYDWNNRGYHEWESPIPEELSSMTRRVIDLLEMEDYNPEALIVNYYNWKSYMGGHLDDGEPDQVHPIVSFSFGLSCVFLIGGFDKSKKPLALRLDSGDVMIMSQVARRCVHGVPRIIEGSFDPRDVLPAVQDLIASEEQPEEDGDVEGEDAGVDGTIQENSGRSLKEFGMTRNSLDQTINYLSENRINMNFRQVVL